MVGMYLTSVFMILDLRLIRVVIKKVDWEWWDKPLISASGMRKYKFKLSLGYLQNFKANLSFVGLSKINCIYSGLDRRLGDAYLKLPWRL